MDHRGKNSAQVLKERNIKKISYGKQIFRKNVQSERIKNNKRNNLPRTEQITFFKNWASK